MRSSMLASPALAAGAGMDLEIGSFESVLPDKAPELAPRHLDLKPLERLFGVGDGLLVLLGFLSSIMVSWSSSPADAADSGKRS